MRHLLLLTLLLTTLFSAQPKFLEPDEAFKPSASFVDGKIVATIDLADDIYVYEDSIKLELKSKDLLIDSIVMPKPMDLMGDNVYEKSAVFEAKLARKEAFSGTKDVEFLLSFQGCSALGLCYEPETKSFMLSVDGADLDLKGEVAKTSSPAPQTAPQEMSQSDEIASKIASGSIVLTLLTFLGFGLLLALTPCTFPMIPIISGIIVSQGEGITTKKAFMLSLVYVLAMSVAYSIAGVLAGLFGSNLQASLQNPIAIYAFSAIFVALALSMFGFYELKLPERLVSKVSTTSSSQKSGYIGVAIMGFLSALIVGPCVAAPLAGALVYIGQSGDALLGGAALFFLSLGMGLPLIAVGVSAGRFMPRPGEWMTLVNNVFGVLMLAVAIWMVSRVVDPYVTLLLSSALGIGFATYFGAFSSEVKAFRRSVALIIFIYSLSLFVGAMGGSSSMMKPLEFLRSSGGASVQSAKELDFSVVRSTSELDALLAQNSGKKIMLDFSASWCASCKELDETTFKDERVISALEPFVLVRADLSENSDATKALAKKYGVFGPPVLLFFDTKQNIVESKRVVGYIGADDFLKHLSLL